MRKIEPKFKLKEPKSETPSLISIIVYYNKKRFVYSTGEKILPLHWNFKKEQAILTNTSEVKLTQQEKDNNKTINVQLSRYKEKAEGIFNYCKYQKLIPNNEFLKKEFDKEFKEISEVKNVSLVEFGKQIRNESISGVRLNSKGNRISLTTIKGYLTTINHLEQFSKARKRRIDLESIDIRFYNEFVKYFQLKGYTTNTIGKNVKNVKVFMKEAYKRGITNNRIYENDDFRVISEDTDQIYLNEKELQKIYNLNLSKNKKFDRVRDLFIIGCYTGLRFSDLSQLHVGNIIDKGKKGKFLKIKTQKTGEIVMQPLHWKIKEILKKYNGQLPPVISNQKMNEYLKKIGGKAKLKDIVWIGKTYGGMRESKSYMKYELITTHTARRSFATNMYLAGVPTISIMKITGHKTEKSFLRYIRISQEDNAMSLKNHSFYRKQLKVS